MNINIHFKYFKKRPLKLAAFTFFKFLLKKIFFYKYQHKIARQPSLTLYY